MPFLISLRNSKVNCLIGAGPIENCRWDIQNYHEADADKRIFEFVYNIFKIFKKGW